MPIISINIKQGKSKAELILLMNTTMDCIQQVLGLPKDDKNIRVMEYDPDLFQTKDPYSIIIEISLFEGRSIETKRKLYKSLTEILQTKLSLNPAELFIVLHDQPKENWGIRGGKAACDVDFSNPLNF